jgi:hypothetical protein
LLGLGHSLSAQGKNVEAGVVERRFDKAWAGADIQISSSRF